MNKLQPVIKWSGGKASQAEKILGLLPEKFNDYFEPFIGGGSILFAVSPKRGFAYDICKPLIGFWNLLKDNPLKIYTAYEEMWTILQSRGHLYYYEVREKFNREGNPVDLLFLSRTCVNGLIRFNTQGEFNNSFHHSRRGIKPETLKKILSDWSDHIQNTSFTAGDYEQSIELIKKNDLVYLDPPYFNTKGRYYGGIDFERFLKYIEKLNSKGAHVMMSFDGTRGNIEYSYDKNIDELFKRKIMLKSGLSSFRKVIDKKSEDVYESILLNW